MFSADDEAITDEAMLQRLDGEVYVQYPACPGRITWNFV
jgi:hypothetical protein